MRGEWRAAELDLYPFSDFHTYWGENNVWLWCIWDDDKKCWQFHPYSTSDGVLDLDFHDPYAPPLDLCLSLYNLVKE